MVRIKDIAKEAGVSPTTVSNVIHGNTKKAQMDVIVHMDTNRQRFAQKKLYQK